MTPKFLLLLGPSGTGTTIIQRLRAMDSRFVYISPFITRRLRKGEQDKVYVGNRRLDKLVRNGKILVVNELYGIRYATPRGPIDQAFAAGNFPLLDWPIERLDVMQQHFAGRLYTVYVEPPDLETLRRRLDENGRDPERKRFAAGASELEALRCGDYDSLIDLRIISVDGQTDTMAQHIYSKYLVAIGV